MRSLRSSLLQLTRASTFRAVMSPCQRAMRKLSSSFIRYGVLTVSSNRSTASASASSSRGAATSPQRCADSAATGTAPSCMLSFSFWCSTPTE